MNDERDNWWQRSMAPGENEVKTANRKTAGALLKRLATDPEHRETDPAKIIGWPSVDGQERVRAYYKQRLGADFEEAPIMAIKLSAFEALIAGEYPIITNMSIENFEAYSSFAIAFRPRHNYAVAMYLNIEDPDPGRLAIEYLSANSRGPDHDTIRDQLITLSKRAGELHLKWLELGKPYYKVTLRRGSAQAERSMPPEEEEL